LNGFDGRSDLVSGERTIHNVTDFLHIPSPDVEDEKLLDEFDLGDVFIGPDPRFQMSDTVQITDKNRILLVCVIVSLLLHFGLAYAIPRLIGVPKPDSLLKPGEVIQPVRLVQQPVTPKSEPPPENPSAISEHNHVAKKERIPKTLPAEKPPLGTMKPQQMASLTPPVAPDVNKPVDEPKPQEETKKPDESHKPKPSTNQERKKPSPDKATEATKPRPSRKPQQRAPDIRPTADEYRTAISGPPGGIQDFYPDGDVEEAVVDLNAKEDNRFYSYLLYLKEKIQGVWVYPRSAAQSGTGGSLTVEFSIGKNGELLFVNLLDSSGHSILDNSAMNAIHTAAPYQPLPDRLRAKRLRIRANFIYITKNSFFGRIM
jgi:periplasmic protein TonB